MRDRRHHRSTLLRAREIREITRAYYEPGNYSRCYKQVWRRYIYPRFGICYATYLKFIGLPETDVEQEPDDPRQLKLFE